MIAAELAVRADVLVENFRPGVMARVGLDYDTLSRTSPGIVYCSVSGFGQSGMMAAWPAYAPIVHAMSGFDAAFLGYQKNSSVPPVSGIQIADVLTATFAFGAIQLALVQRLRTGRGDYVDATLLESILALIAGDLQAAQVNDGSIPSYSAIRSKDGYLMVVVISEKVFRSLCAALGRSDWLTDPRFAGRAFQRNGAVLMEEVERWTMERSAEECERLLMGAGVPCSRYRSLAEVLGNQHLRARGTFIELRDADGAFLVTNPPFRLRGSDYSSERSVPRLGEHTRQVLLEALGIGEDELERLATEKAVVA